MKQAYRVMGIVGAAVLALGLSARAQDKVTVDAGREGPEVNPHMYGVFFEEINHSGDGGIYAELVRNRSFEDCNVPEGMTVSNGVAFAAPCRTKVPWPPKEPVPGWVTVNKGAAAAAMHLDKAKLLNPAQVTSLRLEIERAAADAPAGVANTGYWGMSFREGAKYNLNLYACAAPGFKGALTAVLEDKDGRALSAPVVIRGFGADWKKYPAALTAKETHHNARLALYADAPGTLWLDVVSLFPEDTYAKRPNGLRPDLVQILKDLKPGFMRFPGGCVTEGLTLEQGWQWKKTVGDIAERPGVWNAMWGYRRTDGLGMLEFLQLAEDIGAVSLFCNNMGIACTIHNQGGVPCPPDQIQMYVDDTVDAIAYATDPTDTKWGALRARHGRREPFVMPYVNIGNELNSREYTDRYPAFYKAVKAKNPDIITIAYAPVGNPKAPVEIKDVHDYRNDDWFFSNMTRFDQHPRTGPKIANMELAVRNHANHTLHNALLEAGYMIGLERNADVVRLVAYAPLFMNVNDRRWEPDLIHFDNHRVYGTPSYYTQMMFMHHRPDVVLATEVKTDATPRLYALAGRDRKTGDIIVKIANLTGQERSVEIALQNAGTVARTATEILLTSADVMDRNTFEQPKKVSPVTREVAVAGAAFTHKVPKHAFVILRLKTK